MRIIGAAASLLVLASCSEAPTPPTAPRPTGGFIGVTSANATSFTSTEDGCTYSFLFDHFGVQRRPPPPNVGPQAVGEAWAAVLQAPSHLAGAQVGVTVNGVIVGEGAAGTLEVSFASGSERFQIATPADPAANNGFTHGLMAPAAEGANTLSVTLNLPALPATDAEVQIDSIDVAIQGEACPPAAP